jgi:nicotinamide riboside transporter PnuC
MLSKLDKFAHSPFYNVVVGITFVVFGAVGYYFGGESFVTQWVGGVAAAISIAALIFKTQGYWFWSIVNAILWFILFKHMDLPMLAGLQVSYIIFSLYGIFMWATTKFRIGYDHSVFKDNLGTIISLSIFIYTVIAYLHMKDYAYTTWWYIEFAGVFISIAANWMDAFKYKTNWIGWTATNFLFAPLFFHGHLWGPFVLTFLYQAFCIVGFINWYRDEKRLVREGKVELVGGAQIA